MNPDAPRTILTLEEVAERTRMPLNTLRWLRQQGKGPRTWKLGRRVVAYLDDVDAWVEEQYETTSTHKPVA